MNEIYRGRGVAILGPFPPRPGGVSVQCEILASCLAAAGAQVTRINSDAPEIRRRGRAGKLLLPFAQVISIWRQMRRTRANWQVLHVHAASWWGFMPAVLALSARRWRTRLVISYHGGEAARFLSRWGWLAQPVLRRYDTVLTLTPTQARVFAGHGIASAVVPNIVPIDDFPFRPHGPLAPRLLWLRQLEPRYRPADALAIFKRIQQTHPQAELVMAGGGSLMAELAAQVEREKLAGVRLIGHLSPDAIPVAYAAADLFLNTSAIDNLPLTLIEAAASGLPIVTTDAGAIPDLIENGETGLLAPVGDVEALSAAILRLLHDAELARKLSINGRANAERFSWEQVGPLLAQAYALE
ncbi:MAG: glycosyltransferase family 4 protein [Caldilineales bacterium]|nr:glycosyltransferase family 4 protein [Caldilineales bacterium]